MQRCWSAGVPLPDVILGLHRPACSNDAPVPCIRSPSPVQKQKLQTEGADGGFQVPSHCPMFHLKGAGRSCPGSPGKQLNCSRARLPRVESAA